MWRLDSGNLKNKVYDLISEVIKLLEEKNIQEKRLVKNVYGQLYRSITSVGANMSEADVAITSKEFYRILWIVVRELKESQFWIRLLRKEYGMDLNDYENKLVEILKIVVTIIKKWKVKNKNLNF